ncbi:MAG: CDGSH iron-sulfur domain-containing protein [Sandaracinaceae bacterium]
MTELVSTYEGQALTIVYDRRLCIHAAECGRGSKKLFDATKDPWCDPDAVPVDKAAEIVSRCPTGALKATRKDGQAPESTPEENVLLVSPNGPLYVRGDLRIELRGARGVATRAALCRCGASAQKPFCDGSHERSGFQDGGPVGQRGKPLAERGGPLAVEPQTDGPLRVAGNLTIRAGNGRVAWEGTEAWLCRCGASKNRPFCDGSHKKVGFTAEGV